MSWAYVTTTATSSSWVTVNVIDANTTTTTATCWGYVDLSKNTIATLAYPSPEEIEAIRMRSFWSNMARNVNRQKYADELSHAKECLK